LGTPPVEGLLTQAPFGLQPTYLRAFSRLRTPPLALS